MDKIEKWKLISKYSFYAILAILIIKMLFKKHYGDIGFIITTVLSIGAILLYIISEIIIFRLKKQRNER
jgi:hypothetical protein